MLTCLCACLPDHTHADLPSCLPDHTHADLRACLPDLRFEGESELSYDEMMRAGQEAGEVSSRAGSGGGAASGALAAGPRSPAPATPPPASSAFVEVPLGGSSSSARRKAYTYKLKVYTADKLNAGLGNTTVSHTCCCDGLGYDCHGCSLAFTALPYTPCPDCPAPPPHCPTLSCRCTWS